MKKQHIGVEKFTIGLPPDQIEIRSDYSVPLVDTSFISLQKEIETKIANNIMSQFEIKLIEGLKRKGFEFETRYELERFIKMRCRCIDDVKAEQRIYYVDNIPFFLINYHIEIDSKLIVEDRVTSISATQGYYSFL